MVECCSIDWRCFSFSNSLRTRARASRHLDLASSTRRRNSCRRSTYHIVLRKQSRTCWELSIKSQPRRNSVKAVCFKSRHNVISASRASPNAARVSPTRHSITRIGFLNRSWMDSERWRMWKVDHASSYRSRKDFTRRTGIPETRLVVCSYALGRRRQKRTTVFHFETKGARTRWPSIEPRDAGAVLAYQNGGEA